MSKRAFILIGVFWLLLVGGMVGLKEYTIATGQDVLLRTVPVDPRDLFRGDYVILAYEISTFVAQDSGFHAWDMNDLYEHDMFIPLQIIDGYGEAGRPQLVPPEGLYIKGEVVRLSPSAGQDGPHTVFLEFGIESFFVPEGRGREIENVRDQLEVRVSIDRQGQAVIRALVIDGVDVTF